MDPDSKRLPPVAPRGAGARGASAGRGLQVFVSDGRGRPVRDGGLSRWLARAAPSQARGEVAIALVADSRVRTLNQHYRRTNTPTDVLSFPEVAQNLPRTGSRIPDPGTRQPGSHLGDIVIATGVARRQARDAGHSYGTELRVLALHGLLHLLGYDHEDPDDSGRMARAEARFRRKGGLPAGLIERSGRPASGPAAGSHGRRRKAAR